MKKTAETKVEIHDIFKDRWSPRAFADKPIEQEKIVAFLEAARWTMSGYNVQPWRFIVGVKGTSNYDKVLSCLNEWNQGWAKSAPVLILVVGQRITDFDGSENKTFKYDCGAAAAYLVGQATASGLHAHQMGGVLPDKAKALYNIPEGFELLTGIALGYMGDLDRIDESFHKDEKAPRKRKPLDEIVFGATWGEGNKDIL